MGVFLLHRDACCSDRGAARVPPASLGNRCRCHRLFCYSRRHRGSGPNLFHMFCPSVCGNKPTMASADFCCPIPSPCSDGSQWQDNRPPRVRRVTFPLIPAASTSAVSVQVLGFEDMRLLTHCDRLLCDSCSSGQCFAFGFLQIPPHDGHPCRSANRSPCRADSGLPPPSHLDSTTCTRTAPVTALRTMPGARTKKADQQTDRPSIKPLAAYSSLPAAFGCSTLS